jgi:hypothetical protein
MANETHPAKHSHGDYERRDIGVAGIVYFLVGLVVFLVICHFVVTGLYHFLEGHSEAEQTPVAPLVTNAPKDTRHLDTDYRDYLKQNFPAPQLEIDERNQLDQIRIDEENTLSTYGYIDQKAGTVRIPIERAMDLIAQRGLPTRAQGASSQQSTQQPAQATVVKAKGKK